MRLEDIFLQNFVVKRLFITCIAVSSGVLIAFFYHFIIMGKLLNYSYPYNTFLFIPEDRFADFYNQFQIAANRDPFVVNGAPTAWERAYFPFTYLIMWFLSIFPKKLALIFVLATFAFSFVSIIHGFFLRATETSLSPENFSITKHLITVSVLLSYPVIFTLDRGNLEMLAVLPTILAVILIGKKNASNHDCLIGGVLLGIATAVKLFPGILAILLLKKKKYHAFLLIPVLSILVNIGALFLFKSPVELSLRGMIDGERYWFETYVFNSSNILGGGLAYSSGIFNVIKFIFINNNLSFWVNFYSIAAVILGIFVTYVVIFREKDFVRSVYLLTALLIILPHMSGDYRLMYIFIPLIYLVAQNKRYGFVEWSMFIVMLLVLIPKHYYFLFANVSISVLLNPALISFPIICIIAESIKGRNRYCEKQQMILKNNHLTFWTNNTEFMQRCSKIRLATHMVLSD